MVNCPNCGAPIDSKKDKCSYCGTPYQKKPYERKCGDGCKGCYYRKKPGGNGVSYCDYLGETGKTRGCPAGAGCIHYKPLASNKRLRKYLAEF